MRRLKRLQFTSFIVLLIQLSSINSQGQIALVSALSQFHLSLKSGTDESKNSLTGAVTPGPRALRTRDPKKLSVVDRAYLDAFTILNDDNACSRFFGGRPAIIALTELVEQLKPRHLDRDIAIRMSGQTTIIQSHSTGFAYRLFDRAEINLTSSFFRNNSPTQRHTSVTNLFAPNTRETRVVVLLHELGHLVRASNKQWLLSDDGTDPILSSRNTDRVVSMCREQIDSLSKLTAERQLEMAVSIAPDVIVPN